MQRSKEETESTPETRPNCPPVQERQRPLRRLVGLYGAFRADLLSFDEHADGLVVRVDTFLKRHERKLHFFKPALLSFVGCLVFAGFDAFGGTHLLRHFTTEHVAALGQPYFVLGMFLLALHLLFIAPDGRSIFGKWVIGTYSSLAEHVMLLGWGVFIWLFLVELATHPTLHVTVIFILSSAVLVLIALLFYQGSALCRGELHHWFKGRRGRLMLMRLVGIVFAVVGWVDLHHFIERQRHEG